MEPVLKTGDGATHREFESHTLRQTKKPPLWGGFFVWREKEGDIRTIQCDRVYFVKEGFTLRKIHMTAAHLWQSEQRLWERSNHSVSNRN